MTHFCCCLSTRLGVFLISTIQGILCLLFAVLLWTGVAVQHGAVDSVFGQKIHAQEPTLKVKIATIAWGISASIITLSCIFGLVGTIRKKYSMVRQYATFTKIYLVVFTVIAIAQIAIMWVDKPRTVEACAKVSNNNDQCWSATNTILIIATFLSLIPVFLQAYAAYIISAYAAVLAKEQRKQLPNAHYHPVSNGGGPEVVTEHKPYSYPFTTPGVGYNA